MIGDGAPYSSPTSYPHYFNLLSEEDKAQYIVLRSKLWSPDNKFKRNQRVSSLQKAMELIKEFCIQNDESDWKRCIACGIVWLDGGIAVNTHELKILVNKCKSSINGALQKMGYPMTSSKGFGFDLLMKKIPFLKCNFSDHRMWTVRKKEDLLTPVPERNQSSDDSGFSIFYTPEPFHVPTPRKGLDLEEEISIIFGNAQMSAVDVVPNGGECKTAVCVAFEKDCCCCCPVEWSLQNELHDTVETDEEIF